MESDKLHNESGSDLWALAQYELPHNESKFTIINSSEAAQNCKMTKGQNIKIRFGTSILNARIVTTSGNKTILENEMEALEESKKSFKRKRTTTHLPIACKMPSPAWTNNTNESINSNVDKEISPMLYDQGTQTDYKLLGEGSQQLQMIATQLAQMKQVLSDVWTVVNGMPKKSDCNDRNPHIINSQIKASNEPILLFTNSSNEIVKLNHAKIDDNVTIETYDLNNESSNISYSNCSNMSAAVSSSSIYNSPMTGCHQSPSRTEPIRNPEVSVWNELQCKWHIDEIDEASTDVGIGPNGTKVSKKVLDSIKWSSHTNATRKILHNCFGRVILATHSLTGKPSPAFKGSSKPAKSQLNPAVISDIVHFVSSRCGVPETAVRAVITTKCADENKMMRQRSDMTRRNVLQSTENSNKENDVVDKKTLPQNVTL